MRNSKSNNWNNPEHENHSSFDSKHGKTPKNGLDEYNAHNYESSEYMESYDPAGNIERAPDHDTRPYAGKNSYMATDEDLDELAEYESELEERDYHPIRFRRDGKTGCLGGLMYSIFIISISVVLTCIAWMAASDVLALNKEEKTATITIDKNFEMEDVITQLKDSGIIQYKILFRLFSKIADAEEKIDPGTYELSTIYDYRALVKKMQVGSGAQQTTKIVFPEGYTQSQIFSLLESNDICGADDLQLAAATYDYSYEFLQDQPLGDKKRLEGYLFPDTYEFYQGEQATTALARFLRNFRDRLTAEMLEAIEASGYTLNQIITIASMIQSEAGNSDEDRMNVASVIYNRLNAGWNLGVDATIQYILPERKPVLTYDDLEIDSPYNTYMYPGLPPGPISNPGLDAIMAAIYPAETNYMFYALDTSTNLHKFSVTKAEHDDFVATQDYSG